METNELLSLETFPKRYEACFLENCAVKEDCLHHFSSYNQLPIHGEMQSFPRHLCPKTLLMVVAECFMQRDLSFVMLVSLISLTR